MPKDDAASSAAMSVTGVGHAQSDVIKQFKDIHEASSEGDSDANSLVGTTTKRPSFRNSSHCSELQLRLLGALQANSKRVMDLFREWNEDQKGSIRKDEFTRAVPMLGLQVEHGLLGWNGAGCCRRCG